MADKLIARIAELERVIAAERGKAHVQIHAQQKRIDELETQLAASQARVAQLETDVQFHYANFCDQCRPIKVTR